MHDYKFRQNDLTFRKPMHSPRKLLFRGAALGIAAAAVYGALHLGLTWKTQQQAEAPQADPDIIPLALPPRSEQSERTRPIGSEQDQQTGIPTTRAFSTTLKAIQDQAQSASIAPPTTTEPEVAQADEQAQAPNSIAAGEFDDGNQVASEEDVTVTTDGNGTWIEHEVRPGDSLAKIFRDNDLSPQLLHNILRSGKEAKQLKKIRPKDRLRIHLDTEQQFAELHLQLDALRSVKFSATSTGIESSNVRKETRSQATAAFGVITHSLFASATKAGLPDAITMKMAKIFGWDIDFALEIRPGDRFTVIYEELWADGEQVGSGNVLAAEFVNQGKPYRAIRYKDSHGKVDYYAPDGMPLKKTFFRTPVNFTRISSGFSKRRWHPVLKRARAHKGVDYAAPTGTPVIATGDGTVEYRGWKKGYGNVVYIRHGRKYRTVYGHLSQFAKGLHTGDRVAQGEIIGRVGQTGLATGPHLHYEFHINGAHRNPLTVKAPIADPLPRKEMRMFERIAKPLLASLEQTAGDRVVADAR